ncbi:MAG: response regulator [Deltaproteobacteria bacterium]|nr:response regulator [Deltaproteobacteria bacterium]
MTSTAEEKEIIRILAVDDEPFVLDAIKRLLNEDHYEIFTASSGTEGLSLMDIFPIQIVISDYRMPEMNGVEFLREVCRLWPDTIRIVLSGYADIQAVIAAINEGQIYKFMAKPWNNEDLRITIVNAIDRYRLLQENMRLTEDLKWKNKALQKFNKMLEETVAERTYELKKSMERTERAFEATILVISSIIEARDPYTAGHQQRTAALASSIGRELGLSDEMIDGLQMAATIHDIGKISVPAEILCKSSPLTDTERSLIRVHVQAGCDILKDIVFPWSIAKIVLQHHERMDGSGYPLGLKGPVILTEARILAVADVVEAMASYRPYRAALGIESALDEIRTYKNVRYDATVVDACLRLFEEKKYCLQS